MNVNFIPPATVDVPPLKFESKITLPNKDTALLIVDMQNDFVKEGGSLLVPAAKETILNIKNLIDRAREKKVKVIYTQDSHNEGDKEWEIWPRHCKKGTTGWKIIDDLMPKDEDLLIEKSRYDGFYGTHLEHYMKNVWDIKNLVVVGTVSSICVLHTAASAGLRWYNIIVPADGISALTDFDQAMTLRQVSTLYTGKIVKSCDDIGFT